jgi:hypothetical protein
MDDSLKVALEVVDEDMPINMEARKWGILLSFLRIPIMGKCMGQK